MIRRLAFVAFAVLAACGGTTTSGNDGGTNDAGTSACPATPSDSTPCSREGLECEYPGPAAYCGDVLQCINGQFLDSAHSCGVPLDPSCPATSAAVPLGQACTASVVCDYVDARCGCVFPSGPPQVDGGGLTWHCTTAQAGCAAQRAPLGTSCSNEGQTCDYGACVFGDNPYSSPTAERCTGGIWVRAFIPCPK